MRRPRRPAATDARVIVTRSPFAGPFSSASGLASFEYHNCQLLITACPRVIAHVSDWDPFLWSDCLASIVLLITIPMIGMCIILFAIGVHIIH